ncbi:unnamed protein product [Malus baccata var. baccata]
MRMVPHRGYTKQNHRHNLIVQAVITHRGYTVTSRPGAAHFPGPLHHRSTILSALGPDHALTVLFLGTHEQLPSGSPILGMLRPPSRLTSKFLRNPKPVSSQKASC